jgi:hypothetical protein
MDGVEHNALLTKIGLMSLSSMSGMKIFFSQVSTRMLQLPREIAVSGIFWDAPGAVRVLTRR